MDTSEEILRRESIVSSLSSTIDKTLEALHETWTDIGLKPDVIQNRYSDIYQQVNKLCETLMVESEKERKILTHDIKKMVLKLYSLRKRLRIPGLIEGYEETPLAEVYEEFKLKITEYEQQIEETLSRIQDLLRQEDTLCKDLGRVPKGLNTKPLPLPNEVNDFEDYLDQLREVVNKNEEEVLELREEIKNMLYDLGEEKKNMLYHLAVEEFQRLVVSPSLNNIPVTDENMLQLRKWHASLKSQVEDKQNQAKELREKLISLWGLLEEDPEYRSKFTNENSGFSSDTIYTMKIEIERCEQKIRENIKIFVEKFRTEIAEYWDKCMFGEQQRREFTFYRSDFFDEDMLTIHELQLKNLKLFYENNKTIFKKLEQRTELMQRFKYLSERTNCSDRYKNRGGQLLQEEKERKQVTQKLPLIEKQIVELVKQYMAKKGEQFYIFDRTVEEAIEDDWSEFRKSQSEKKKARDVSRSTRDLLKTTTIPSRLTSKLPSDLVLRPTMSPKMSSASNKSGVKRKLLTVVQPKYEQPKKTRPAPGTPLLDRSATDIKKRRISVSKSIQKKVTLQIRRKLHSTRTLKRLTNSSKKKNVPPRMKPLGNPNLDEYALFEHGVSVRSSLVPGSSKENV